MPKAMTAVEVAVADMLEAVASLAKKLAVLEAAIALQNAQPQMGRTPKDTR